ncbi:hypothetical protein [Lichenihabitans psoromatis]|uniref:hypothetical protein n=1 Tax=Lichenihabitans psoromatis TaxID=2528642 RepID=UPI0010369557|nr:hypothetical protein [Lichenihabitans psoromatis]
MSERTIELDRLKTADDIDEVRHPVEAASMATADFLPDSRAAALRTLLAVIDDKLSLISDTVRQHSVLSIKAC